MAEVTMDLLLQALQRWYAGQCDGDWEHSYGVEITTLDNPGWGVKIDLLGTELEARPFETIEDPADPEDFGRTDRWYRCWIGEGVWQGAGDETKLTTILQIFVSWAGIH